MNRTARTRVAGKYRQYRYSFSLIQFRKEIQIVTQSICISGEGRPADFLDVSSLLKMIFWLP